MNFDLKDKTALVTGGSRGIGLEIARSLGIAKAGIEMMTKVLAAELALFNVQVNAVAPAMVRTDFSKPFWDNKELLGHVTSTIPMARIAEIEDVVKPVLFLASKGSPYITGQTLAVDGGATII